MQMNLWSVVVRVPLTVKETQRLSEMQITPLTITTSRSPPSKGVAKYTDRALHDPIGP